MNKGELVDVVARRMGGSKAAAAKAVDAVFHAVADGVREDDHVTITGFGTFTRKKRKARTGRNPMTGEPMHIEPSTTVTFRASPGLKDAMNPQPAGE